MPSQRHIALVRDEEANPLLTATRSCLLDLGLRRTTLAEIARRAGVSRMTAYRQYGDRDALVTALLTAELTEAMERITVEVAHLATGRERLVEAAARLLHVVSTTPVYRRILDLDPELLLPLMVDRFGTTQRFAIEAMTDQIREGRRDGSIRRGPSARAMAEHLCVALQAFVFSARVLEATSAPSVTAREVRALVNGYLA